MTSWSNWRLAGTSFQCGRPSTFASSGVCRICGKSSHGATPKVFWLPTHSLMLVLRLQRLDFPIQLFGLFCRAQARAFLAGGEQIDRALGPRIALDAGLNMKSQSDLSIHGQLYQ